MSTVLWMDTDDLVEWKLNFFLFPVQIRSLGWGRRGAWQTRRISVSTSLTSLQMGRWFLFLYNWQELSFIYCPFTSAVTTCTHEGHLVSNLWGLWHWFQAGFCWKHRFFDQWIQVMMEPEKFSSICTVGGWDTNLYVTSVPYYFLICEETDILSIMYELPR